jgi:uncharacterized membrane protein
VLLPLKITAAAIVVIGYLWLMYVSASGPDAVPRTVILTLWAWQAFAVFLLVQNKRWIWAFLTAMSMLLPVVFYADLRKLEWLVLVPNTLINGSLAWFFGRTLEQGNEPLVTKMALKIHGSLPDYMVRYTRQLTGVWTAFFVLQVVGSLALYWVVSFEAWSKFSNVYSLPSLIGMFVFEYAYRRLRFPNFEHVSILAGVKSFMSLSEKSSDKPDL